MQAIWWIILGDPELREVYKHGFVMMFEDGIERLVFPRFCTYSADYMEKYSFSHSFSPNTYLLVFRVLYRVLLMCLRTMGRCPCPRCLIKKDQIGELGTKRDMKQRQEQSRQDCADRRETIAMAHRRIYERGYSISSVHIERLLGLESLVPTQVSLIYSSDFILNPVSCRALSQTSCSSLMKTFTIYLCLTSFTSSRSGSGKRYLPISFGSPLPSAEMPFKY